MPAIEQPYRDNFNTLQRAFANGDACLLDCRDRRTGHPRRIICAVTRHSDGSASFVPLAALFDTNPYETLDPPEV